MKSDFLWIYNNKLDVSDVCVCVCVCVCVYVSGGASEGVKCNALGWKIALY